jgi:hypothetical protein
MSKKRAFVRYSKQGKIVPGSLILTSGSYPNGSSTWSEVPADLCCNTIQDGGYTCCIAIQAIADVESGQYGFTLQTRNGGPNLTGSIQWTSVVSESFSLVADGSDYDFEYDLEGLIPHTVYLCIDNPSQIQDFEIGFGPGQAVAISNLQKLEGIDEWDGDDMAFTSLDFTGITTFRQLYNQSSGLVHINITGCINLDDVNLNNNALTQASVDHVLITLDSGGLTGGFVDVSGGTNSAPSVLGSAAEASLILKGWSVTVNP